MTDLWAILIAVGGAVGLFIWGRVRGTNKDKSDQFKKNADAHVKGRKAQDEMDKRDADSVTEWLRRRSGK